MFFHPQQGCSLKSGGDLVAGDFAAVRFPSSRRISSTSSTERASHQMIAFAHRLALPVERDKSVHLSGEADDVVWRNGLSQRASDRRNRCCHQTTGSCSAQPPGDVKCIFLLADGVSVGRGVIHQSSAFYTGGAEVHQAEICHIFTSERAYFISLRQT